jgi:integrase/recombinase XerD
MRAELRSWRIPFKSCRSAKLLEDWLEYRGIPIAPLFCPIYQGKEINRELTDTVMRRLMKEPAQKSGFDRFISLAFSGHSMRLGTAQDLLSAGHNTAAIIRAGGWKSVDVLVRYLE